MDEILVKGQDGKWYILKGEELLPYNEGEGTQGLGTQVRGSDLPKGVSEKVYEKFERVPVAAGLAPAPIASVKAAATLPIPISHAEHPLFKELEELVDGVMQNVKLKTPNQSELGTGQVQNVPWRNDPLLEKRFRTIVSARLRDVRDTLETQEMLTRGQKVGGIGLGQGPGTGDQVAGVIGIIEKAFGEFQAKWKEAEEKKRIAWQQKQREEVARRQEEGKRKDEEELEERYRRLTGGNPKFFAKGESALGGEIRNPKQIPKQEIQTLKPISSVKSPHPLVPVAAGLAPAPKAAIKAAATPALVPALKAAATPPPPMQSVPVPKAKPVVASVLKPVVPPKPFVPSVEQSSVSARPGKVTDIRPAPKLVGPVDEIASLRLEDFRRLLGTTAQERAQKIMEKIELLGKESLVRRSQGLEAWRNCPLNQLYGQILGAALQNRKPPQTILTEWASSGKTSLTLDEFRAIMELNQKLRF